MVRGNLNKRSPAPTYARVAALPPRWGDSAARLLCDDFRNTPTMGETRGSGGHSGEFPVANPLQHPYTLNLRRMLLLRPVPARLWRGIGAQGRERTKRRRGLHSPVQTRQILRFATNFGPSDRTVAVIGSPVRKRSYGPQADTTRRDRFRLPLCRAAFAGSDQYDRCAQGRASAPHHPQTIRLALRHGKDAGLPADPCRRASARS
jgi:hypothetical protein